MKINPTKTIHEIITVLPYITDIDDQKKLFHSWRVGIIAGLMDRACRKGIDVKHTFYAGLLHDIGGVGFPIHIIHYLVRRDKTSRNILLSHPIIGAQLVSDIPQMVPVAKIILDHHEWINGMGYPRAKIDRDIPYGSQLIRIADTIDIMFQRHEAPRGNVLAARLRRNVGREYTKDVYALACDVVCNAKMFARLKNKDAVAALFSETKDAIGMLYVPSKMDAVGKTLEAVAQIIDMKHPFTAGHSLRVSRYALAIALSLKLSHDDITRIRWAGLLHDIGKLTVLRRLLDKPTQLTAEEYKEIQKHAKQTYHVMDLMPSLRDITLIAAAHHERADGSGYPFGLKGEEIPLGARILSVCDAFDAMTSNRPYRQPLTFKEAADEIEKLAGKQFDAEIVHHALPLLRNLGF